MNLWSEYQKKVDWKKFDEYRVKLKIEHLVGGLPMDPDLIDIWVKSTNKEKTKEERDKIKNAHLEELDAVTGEVAERKGIGFARVSGGLAIEGRQIKACLKENANIIKGALPTSIIPQKAKKKDKDGNEIATPPVTKIAALKNKVAEQLFVDEEYISIGRTEPDEVLEKPISVITAQGPRTSIKRYEICHDVEIEFTLKRMARGGEVTEKVMLAILDYAQQMGLGADRSQGRGRFEVVSVEKV